MIFFFGFITGVVIVLIIIALGHLVRAGGYDKGYRDAVYDAHLIDIAKSKKILQEAEKKKEDQTDG